MNKQWLKLTSYFVILFGIYGIYKSLKADEILRAILYLTGLILLLVGIYRNIRKMNSISSNKV